jgi:hypothetical protein
MRGHTLPINLYSYGPGARGTVAVKPSGPRVMGILLFQLLMQRDTCKIMEVFEMGGACGAGCSPTLLLWRCVGDLKEPTRNTLLPSS